MNYKSSVDRAKSYVNDFLKRSDKSSDVIVDEKIWQLNKKYIAVQISADILIINQHRAHFKILYDQFLESINGKPLGGQTLLFPEKIELSFDLKSTLMDMLPFLEKTGFRFREFELRISIFLIFLDSKFPYFQVPWFPGPQKSGLGQAWAAWAGLGRAGPGLGQWPGGPLGWAWGPLGCQ